MTALPGRMPALSARLAPASSRSRGAGRLMPMLVAGLGFISFMPYPAIPIGNASAIQLGNLLALALLLPALALSSARRAVWLYALILAPLILSAIKVAITGEGDLDVCFNSISAWGLACLTIIVAQAYAPRYSLHLLTGIAVAIIVHAAVGVLQLYCFSNGEFPMADWYVNQSFYSVTDNAFVIANYIQRPFGFFPEPSAMSSSLAPWVLLYVAEICGIIRFSQEPSRGQRILFAAASAGGIALIIMSQSGHTFVTLSAVLLFGIIWLFKAKATRNTFGVVAAVFGVILPLILWWGVASMSNRIGGEMRTPNGSWDERSASIAVGFALWAQGDPATILFGLGTGLSPTAVSHAAGLDAVASVLLGFILEAGIVGAVALLWMGMLLLRAWRASGWNIAFAMMAIAWLFGITFVTSYTQLLPIWVAFAWLMVWPVESDKSVRTPAPREARTHFRPHCWTLPKPGPAEA